MFIAKKVAVSKKYIHVRDAAEKVGVHPQTLKRWLKHRKVKVTWGKDRRKWIYSCSNFCST